MTDLGKELESPSQSVPQLDTNPEAMPTRQPLGDYGATESPECDISGMSFDPTDTVPMTLGSLRPIQGYTPAADLPWAQEWMATAGESTIADPVVPADQQQLSINLIVRGTNIIMPLSLPPVPSNIAKDSVDATVIDSNALETLFFQGNGPSIATPGSTRRAAVEQAMSTMRSQIVNSFNRDIPFTDVGMGARTLLLRMYEQEICNIQVFFQSLDRIRGLAKYYNEKQIALSDRWQNLYDPALYTSLLAVYNSVQDLLIYDEIAHKRIEKLGGFFTARKRGATPGGVMMQDLVVGDYFNTEGLFVKAENSAYAQNVARIKYSLSHIVPCKTMREWMNILLDPGNVAAVQAFNQAVKTVRTQYEVVITALNQMVAKGAVTLPHLADYIPAQPNGGMLEFADAQPAFSYAFHERFEYAPTLYDFESGSSGVSGYAIWNLSDLPPVDGAPRSPAACLFRRPVGLRHGSSAWTIAEIIDIGLFKSQVTTNYLPMLAKDVADTGVWAAMSDAKASALVDAVYGDIYAPGSFVYSSNVLGNLFYVGGMSIYPAASGIHNLLDPPFTRDGQPGSAPSDPFIGLQAWDGWGRISDLPGGAGTQVVRPVEYFINQLCEQFDLNWIIIPKTNATGVRRIPYVRAAGYADSGFYEFALPAVDNAVSKAYLDMVPLMEYHRKGRA